MKKKLLLFLMALVWWPMLMQAVTEDGISYLIGYNGIYYGTIYNSESGRYEATVNSYSGKPTDVVIPSTIENEGEEYTVTSIKKEAFKGCSSLTSVVIPIGVTSIEEGAFDGCTSLTSVVIPEGVTSIKDHTFYRCSSLTSVVIPEGVTSIGEYAFYSCSSLTSVEIPEGVTSIGDNAFEGCSSLTSVVIPEGVRVIEDCTFYGCTSLTSVVIPEGVLYIFPGAFYGCTSLASIEIPKGVIYIGIQAFDGCTSLSSVVIPEGVSYLGDYAFNCCTSLTSVVILEGVTSIGEKTFSGCSSLISVVLPEGVTSIGGNAFTDCSSLTSVVFPEGVTTIGRSAFYRCTSLTSVEMPKGMTSIGDRAFSYCSRLSSVEIPKGVTSIGAEVFYNCSKLTSVVLPEGVTSIGDKAFYRCNIKKVILPASIEKVGGSAFDYISIAYPSTFDAGQLNGIKYKYDPEDYKVLEGSTLLTNEGKTLVMVPNVEGEYSIPDDVERITYDAFKGCTGISNLTIPASVKTIEADAFKDLQFERVNFVDWSEWYANVNLGNINSNPYRDCEAYAGGIRITTPELKEGMTEIKDYINAGLSFRDEVEIPSTVKRIGAYAFYNNREIYNVFLNEGLEEIGEKAFYGCELLENPVFPKTLEKIESEAYRGCTAMTEISLPDGLTQLGNNAFSGCTGLEKAIVAIDTDYIPSGLFSWCEKLNKVYLPTDLKTIGDRAFSGCILDEVTFPATLEEIGSSAYSGAKLKRVVLPNSVKSIGSRAFWGNEIEYLSIGSGIEIIPEYAFSANPIQVIEFSEGLKTIESYSFSDNRYGIGSVILPSSLSEIEDNAFANTSILELSLPDNITSLLSGSCGKPAMLTLGNGVKEIDAQAFGFDNLKVLRVKSNTPPTLSDAFQITTEQNDNLTLVVNNGRRNNYVTNARWKQFSNIIEEGSADIIVYMTGEYSIAEEIRLTSGYMPSRVTGMKVVGPLTSNDLDIISRNMKSLKSLDLSEATGVTEIPERMFSESLITNIALPANLESIGGGAFEMCHLLKLSELPSSVKNIGVEAFFDCPLVTISELPATVETIGDNAFCGCGLRSFRGGENLKSIGAYAFGRNTLLETVDLSATAIDNIAAETFLNCTSLDEIILPNSVRSIGRRAFSNTAVRDIDFIGDADEIGDQAFQNCRRLVTANLPEKIEEVADHIFANCPRIISVSMPASVNSVATEIVSNDRKLANISCANTVAPEATTGAFRNIRYNYVSLTVPTLSFRSYLNAPEWGAFESIKNRIPVVIDEGVEVTNVAEDEYQDMIKEDALEEAQEAAAEERNEEEAEMSRRRVARRAAARAATSRQFAKLFDGAQIQTGSDGSGTRIFITPQEGVTVTSVKFNGEEMISKLEGHSLLLPAGSNGQLEIRTNAPGTPTGVGMIYGDIDPEAVYDVYDLNGILIGHDMDSLERGIYIIRQGATVKKINVR